ncbi:hypothetical protein QCA50_017620 [Cerrena zonata]|uniref:Nucleoporin Nup54 alpha-helical domain-containing protein n=1 Tax=Cerrena zonata TaxID=2478898 RepID=A0AAW0FK37_9APHY
MFGASSNNSGGSGMFGSNTSNNTSGGGLFGAAKPAASSGTGFSFGSNSNQPSTSFGASNTNTNTQSGGGLFGGSNTPALVPLEVDFLDQNLLLHQVDSLDQITVPRILLPPEVGSLALSQLLLQPQPQQPQPSGGLFGQNTTNNSQPSFGWSSQQNNKPALGAATTSNATNNNISLPFNSNNSTTSNVNTYTPAINDQLLKIKEQWDPNSPKCALKTHLYNKFNDQEINMLLSQQRPANESSEDWDAAMSNRPTPQHYPIKITSFTEVAQRVEVQLDHVAKSRILLNTINDRQSALSSKHDLDNTTRILKAKAKHTKLSRRLLRLATILAILRLKGYPLLPEEEEISRQFDLLNDKLNDPNASLGKLNDVFARLAILKERSEELANQFDSSVNTMNGGLNQSSNDISNGEARKDHVEEKSNDELVNKLTKLLLKQQQGLNYLNEVLQKDFDEVKKISPDN